MRLDREATEGLREKLSAAVLLAAIVLLRTANAQQSVAPAAGAQQAGSPKSDASHAASPHRGLPEIYQRLFSDEAARGGRPADPAELARLRYGGKSFRDWQELYLTDLEPGTRLEALPALTKLGQYGYGREAAETIAAAFVDQDSEFVDEAIKAAAGIGPEAVPALVELCQKNRGRVRRNGAQALAKMGQGAADAVPALFDMLAAIEVAESDKFDELEYRYLRDALDRIEIPDDSLPFLLERLDSPKPRARGLAAELLGRLGSEAASAASALLSALDDQDPRVRVLVGAALWKVATEDDKVIAMLRAKIRSGDAETREGILMAISEWFSSPRPDYPAPRISNAMSLLAEELRSSSFAEGIAAFKMVPKQIAGEGTVYVIEGGPNATAAHFAVQALQAAGAEAKSLMPDLVKLLESSNEKAAAAAASVLGSIGPEAASTLPQLHLIVERRQKQGLGADDELLQAARAAIEQIVNLPAPAQASPYGSNPYSGSR